MQPNPVSDLGDPSAPPPAGDPWPPELPFEGISSLNDPYSAEDGGKQLNPRVSAISSSAGAKYKSMSPARLPIARSPCLTIPPGLSPTSLLESPVLLTNVKVELSPTTGTFTIPSIVNDSFGSDALSSPIGSSNNSSCEEGCSGDFEFKPHSRLCSGSELSVGNLTHSGSGQHQCEPFGKDQTQSQHGMVVSSCVKPEHIGVMSNDLTLSVTTSLPVGTAASRAVVPHEVAGSIEMQQSKDLANDIEGPQMDHKGPDPLNSIEKTTEDGYNWRKYGQKHVKGSEFPRSYYKCTHPNCQVKKQLERSYDGHITDIIYKGKHDHPKPQPSRRSAIGAVFFGQEEDRSEGLSSSINMEDKTSVADGQICHDNDSNGIQEITPLSVNEEDIEGVSVLSGNNCDDDADNDDLEAKRRRKDAGGIDMAAIGKITREPRVVIQTLSEVDILDDGYRWRKYGQKVVKGNPNPRSYYKCTNVGCPVRKHVERASHDPKAVITTYEGKHNHDVPAARTSSHDTAAPMAINGGSTHNNWIPVPRTYDEARAISYHYNQPEESDTISLDLGVGLSPRQKDGSNKQQQIPEAQHSETQNSSGCSKLAIQPTTLAPYHGSPSNLMDCYGSREDNGESFSFKAAPLNHPSNPYDVNMGSLLMRP